LQLPSIARDWQRRGQMVRWIIKMHLWVLGLTFAAAPIVWSAPSYSLSDLGNINGIAINNAGQVLGSTAVYQGGVSTLLGLPAGATPFAPTGINASGRVVGNGRVTVAGGITIHNHIWTNGVFADLGTQAASNAVNYSAWPVAINNAGTAAGQIGGNPALQSGAIITNLTPGDYIPVALNGSNVSVGSTRAVCAGHSETG
jgi:hypothetical protein